jgi:glycerol-3-phosphate dehydrogenase (NAD(P)+)
MTIRVIGAGAFGTALAVTWARAGRVVELIARDAATAAAIAAARQNRARLPGVTLPPGLMISGRLGDVGQDDVLVLAVPAQALGPFLSGRRLPDGHAVVAACKGLDLTTLQGPSAAITAALPGSMPAVLTGPSFAADIAAGLPTALTLACSGQAGPRLQAELSVPHLRLYLTDDLRGAELGGALKNVIAIAAGAVIGAGFGESARAAVIARGFAEMTRLAAALGARAETLGGLSGLGDLVLTCASPQSRNFRFGVALGQRQAPADETVEGRATAQAAADLAARHGVDTPLIAMVAALCAGRITFAEAAATLLSRPLKPE